MAAVTLVLGAAILPRRLPMAILSPLFALCLAIAAIPLSSELSLTVGGLNLTLMEPAVGTGRARLAASRRSPALAPCGSGPRRSWPPSYSSWLCSRSPRSAPKARPSLKDTLKWIGAARHLRCSRSTRHVTRVAARWVVLAVVGAAGLEASYGMFQFGTRRGPDFFAIGPFMRATATSASPTPSRAIWRTALPSPLAVALLQSARDTLGALGAGGRPGRYAAGVLLSFSRGAWLGVACAAAVMLAAASARSRRWLVAAGARLLLLGRRRCPGPAARHRSPNGST